MIDWLTIVIALFIITGLVGGFGYLAWKMNMSDPLLVNENQHVLDANHEKKRKEKNSSEQSKKKQQRKENQKKSKREIKDEEQEKSSKRHPPTQTSEETDDEREESEQELVNVPAQTVETSSKARKRNKNKTRSTTPPPPPSSTTASSDNQKKNPLTTRPTHPKSASKDEFESAKQSTKGQPTTKPTANKKSAEFVQKQTEEQPFTVVGGNRNKPTPAKQPQPNPNPVVQPLAPRPKEPTPPVPVPAITPQPAKATPMIPPKIADLIKALPSSQAVVTEIMSALDAFALSADELDIIMHKIANKQSVVKQDWTKLQQGQKVNPQAQIGQALDDSAKAYEDSIKGNSSKHVQDLSHELQVEKRRNHELLKEKQDKDREIQILHAQLDSVQQKSDLSNPIQLELKRLTDENNQLSRQLNQQQSSSSPSQASEMKVQVLSEQIKKLSVDNATWEKKATTNELSIKQVQKEKEELIRSQDQLTQALHHTQKELKQFEEKSDKQIHQWKCRIDQLEKENEQLKREEIVHVEPSTATDIQTLTVNNEEREQFENEIERLKHVIQSYEGKEREMNEWKENELKQEKNRQVEESRNDELNRLQTELNEVKTTSQQRLGEEREKHRRSLIDLLPGDLRHQLPSDHQNFDQWFSSYRQLVETNKRNVQQESEALRRENTQIYQNMTDAEKQLKDIEQSLQSKEENLLTELKHKDATVENLRGEKDHLSHEVQHLRQELQTVRANHDAIQNEVRALKAQLTERYMATTNSPSIVAADESFELLKQPSPSLSPIVVDVRAEPFNDIGQSSKEGSIEREHGDNSTSKVDHSTRS